MSRNLCIFLLFSVTLAACSTVATGMSQTVMVITPHAEGAECELVDSKGAKWRVKNTPDAVTVGKGNGPMTVTCHKKGYKTGITILGESTAYTTFGNVVIGGGVGVIADILSGAAQEYPNEVQVWLEPEKWKSKSARQAWLKEKGDYEQLLKKPEIQKQERGDYEFPRKKR